MDLQQSISEWVVGRQAWAHFATCHPELGFKDSFWQFHNFLRTHREALVGCDSIRKARGRWWIAHPTRFAEAAFACATGRTPVSRSPG